LCCVVALLVWRIWRIEHQNEKFRAGNMTLSAPVYQPRLRKVIRVVAESGLAYSTLVFLTFVVSVCNSNTLYPFSDAVGRILFRGSHELIFRCRQFKRRGSHSMSSSSALLRDETKNSQPSIEPHAA
jgi:hypothetical protein